MGNHKMEAIITTSAIMIGSIQEALRTPIVGGTTTPTHTRPTITRHQRSIQPITIIRSRTIITTPGGQPMYMDGIAGLGTLTTLKLRDEFGSLSAHPPAQ